MAKKDQGFSSQVNTIIDDKANGKDFFLISCVMPKRKPKQQKKNDPYGIAKNAENA